MAFLIGMEYSIDDENFVGTKKAVISSSMAMNYELVVDANTKSEESIPRFEKSPLCQIEEGLFVGSYADANNKDALKSSNVTHILTVANLKRRPFPIAFTYKTIEVMDIGSTNITQYFDECFDFIEGAKRSGGGVLVHCFMGISRSVTVVVAYLMKKHGMSMSQALETVKRKRPQAAPNSGFTAQLLLLEKSLQDDKTKLNLSEPLKTN